MEVILSGFTCHTTEFLNKDKTQSNHSPDSVFYLKDAGIGWNCTQNSSILYISWILGFPAFLWLVVYCYLEATYGPEVLTNRNNVLAVHDTYFFIVVYTLTEVSLLEKLLIGFVNVYPIVNEDYRSVIYIALIIMQLWKLYNLSRELPFFHLPTLGVAISTTGASLLLTVYQAYLTLFAKDLQPYVTIVVLLVAPRFCNNLLGYLVRDLVNIDLSKAQSPRELNRVLILSNLIRYYTPTIVTSVKRTVQQSRESNDDWDVQAASDSNVATGDNQSTFSGDDDESKALIDLIAVVSTHSMRITTVVCSLMSSSER